MLGNFHGSKPLNSIILLMLVAVFVSTLSRPDISTPTLAHGFILLWLSAAIFSSIMMRRDFVSGFLICLFSTLIAWRIAAIYNNIIIYPMFITFIFLGANFFYNAYKNIYYPEKYKHQLTKSEWQLVFVRIYLGFNFIPHFTEKLFAGPVPHLADVHAFINLGVPHADLFVWLAGLCEFGAAIAIGMGFIMRLGGLGAALYLFIATFLGHHFSLGFIWAGPGGGWEFSALWIILIMSYVITGFRQFSLDQRLKERFRRK